MAAQRKSPMGVDKSSTPVWMRVVIVLVALSFVAMLVPVVFSGFGKSGGAGPAGQSQLFEAEYQPRVDAALVAAKADPENADILAQVGHAYYEWAARIFESGQQTASIPMWKSAVSYYDRVLAIRPDDNIVLGNKAFALYYASDPEAKAALQAFVDAAAGNTTLAAQVDNARQMLNAFDSQPTGSPEATPTP